MSLDTTATSRAIALRVAAVITETAEARSLVFDVPEELAERFRYRPGQFLTLRIPSARTGSVARCYSLSSSPYTDDRLTVTVKRTPDGYASNWLCDTVTPGQTLEVLPPAGVFTPDDLDADLLLLAAGSGITPVISILKSALHQGTGHTTLLYANRDAESVIFGAGLRELARRHPDRFTVLTWLESEQGLPTAATLVPLVAPYSDRPAFLCGPAAFMDSARRALSELGVSARNIHQEIFNSLTSDPFTASETTSPPADQDVDGAMVAVELDGQIHELSWPRHQSLVEIMLHEGIDVPYSCQAGECGSCMCTVVEGKVTMDNCEILDPADIADGYVLGCQSHPVTDRVRIQF